MNGNQPLDIAQIKTIGLDGLRNNCSDEKQKLFSASKEDGIFYLDISVCGPELCDAVARLKSLSRSLFSLPYEEKMRFDIDAISPLKINGYKPIGRNIGGHDGKERDGFETYAVSVCWQMLKNTPKPLSKMVLKLPEQIPRNSILSLTEDPFPRPCIMDEYTNVLKIFTLGCMDIANTVFTTLSEALSLPREKSFESFHNSSLPSPDIVRLLRYARSPPGDSPRVPHTPHTDLGSLTLLFADSPGLQILPDGSDTWLNVMPKPGHIIINFGDAMSILTGGLFRTILHRVASAPGSPMKERYSLAFLMRPENSTPMCPVPSTLIKANSGDEVVTSEDWLRRKFGVLRGNMNSISEQVILTGGRVI